MTKLGTWGEERACGYLEEKGYHILERNFRCRTGELDIVAKQSSVLCFVEVKSRRSIRLGWPAEAVTAEKQRRLRSAIAFYMVSHPWRRETSLRIDVVEILRCGERVYIRHIENAF